MAHRAVSFWRNPKVGNWIIGTLSRLACYLLKFDGQTKGETKMAPKRPANAGKHWTRDDIAKLRQLARENTPTREGVL